MPPPPQLLWWRRPCPQPPPVWSIIIIVYIYRNYSILKEQHKIITFHMGPLSASILSIILPPSQKAL